MRVALRHEALLQVAGRSDSITQPGTLGPRHADTSTPYGLSSSRQSAQIAKESLVGQLLLTHLSPTYEDPKSILEDAEKVFPTVRVAEDFLEIDVPYPE